MGKVRTSHPRFRRNGDAPPMALTEDDVAILKCVHHHRFVRADDLHKLFEGRSKDRFSRRLTLLYRNRYLDRPIAQIDRFRVGGSQPFVYGLDIEGARYLKETIGVPLGRMDWQARNRSYTRENLEHTLATSRFMVDLEAACRMTPNVSVLTFEDILAATPEITRQSRNPMCWEVPVQWSGGKAIVQIAPDAIFGLRIVREDGTAVRSYFFLEVDKGTMTIVPSERVLDSEAFGYRATILRKLFAYADSYRLALHEHQFGIKRPRVLFLTTSEARAEAMTRAAKRFVIEPQHLPTGLFAFGLLSLSSTVFNVESLLTLGL